MKILFILLMMFFISCGDTNTTVGEPEEDCVLVNMKEQDIKDCKSKAFDSCIAHKYCDEDTLDYYGYSECDKLKDRFVCKEEEE